MNSWKLHPKSQDKNLIGFQHQKNQEILQLFPFQQRFFELLELR